MGSGSLSSFSLRERMFRSHPCFGLPFSHISLEYFAGIDIADRPKYIPGVVKWGRFIGRSGKSWRPGKSKFLRWEIDVCVPLGIAAWSTGSAIRNIRIRKFGN